jgi:hypothetical protein
MEHKEKPSDMLTHWMWLAAHQQMGLDWFDIKNKGDQ